MLMKVLLTSTLKRIHDPKSWRLGKGQDSFNYGIACVAAMAEKAGYDVECLDLFHNNWRAGDLERHVVEKKFDVVGIGFFTPQTDLAQKTAAVVKRVLPNSKVVFGGIHVTSVPVETLDETPEADACVIGEGDYTFTELLDCWRDGRDIGTVAGIAYRQNGKARTSGPRGSVRDLDDLPMPSYRLFPMREYEVSPNISFRPPTVSFQVTRGCPFKCTFCEYTTVGGPKIRHKTIPRIIDEIRYLRDEFGFHSLVFRDSTLPTKRKFLVELCEAMIEAKIDMPWMCYSRVDLKQPRETFRLMKRAGCWQIGFGCESGNQKTLDRLKKATTVEQNMETLKIAYGEGLSISTTWMLALPGETVEDAENTIRFALDTPAHIAKFYLPVPYPRSNLERACREDGGLREGMSYANYDLYDQSDPIYVNPLIGKERQVRLTRDAYRRFYSSPRMWGRNLAQIRNLDMVKRYYDGVRLLLAG